jgi:restriction system protein
MGLLQNRTHWAVTYLFKAKAVSRPQRGHVEITDRGRALLEAGGPIRNSTLEQFPEYREFYDKYRSKKAASASAAQSDAEPAEDASPDDLIARAELAARATLVEELLEKLRSIEPAAFEKLVLRLLQAMDYGTSGAVEHSGRSGDGGIDGIITQDALGLDRIYIQAKRYAAGNSVQSPEIRNFLGALMGQQGDRGVFLTTSSFTTGAVETARTVSARVVLIDGDRLAELMIDHGVGVQEQRVTTLHRIDEDFFEAL